MRRRNDIPSDISNQSPSIGKSGDDIVSRNFSGFSLDTVSGAESTYRCLRNRAQKLHFPFATVESRRLPREERLEGPR